MRPIISINSNNTTTPTPSAVANAGVVHNKNHHHRRRSSNSAFGMIVDGATTTTNTNESTTSTSMTLTPIRAKTSTPQRQGSSTSNRKSIGAILSPLRMALSPRHNNHQLRTSMALVVKQQTSLLNSNKSATATTDKKTTAFNSQSTPAMRATSTSTPIRTLSREEDEELTATKSNTISNNNTGNQKETSPSSNNDMNESTDNGSSTVSVSQLKGWLTEFGQQNKKHYEKNQIIKGQASSTSVTLSKHMNTNCNLKIDGNDKDYVNITDDIRSDKDYNDDQILHEDDEDFDIDCSDTFSTAASSITASSSLVSLAINKLSFQQNAAQVVPPPSSPEPMNSPPKRIMMMVPSSSNVPKISEPSTSLQIPSFLKPKVPPAASRVAPTPHSTPAKANMVPSWKNRANSIKNNNDDERGQPQQDKVPSLVSTTRPGVLDRSATAPTPHSTPAKRDISSWKNRNSSSINNDIGKEQQLDADGVALVRNEGSDATKPEQLTVPVKQLQQPAIPKVRRSYGTTATGSSTSTAAHRNPYEFLPKPKATKIQISQKIEATDNTQASVSELKSWLKDKPFDNNGNKKVGPLRSGTKVIAKSRMFEDPKLLQDDPTLKAANIDVKDKKKWLENAFGSNKDGKEDSQRSLNTTATSTSPLKNEAKAKTIEERLPPMKEVQNKFGGATPQRKNHMRRSGSFSSAKKMLEDQDNSIRQTAQYEAKPTTTTWAPVATTGNGVAVGGRCPSTPGRYKKTVLLNDTRGPAPRKKLSELP